jgi:ATP-binding protein involved in chromosome partitioning
VDWGVSWITCCWIRRPARPIHLTLVQTVPKIGAVIVTTPQKVALADAQKGLQMFRQPQINVPVLGVVGRTLAWFIRPSCPTATIFW